MVRLYLRKTDGFDLNPESWTKNFRGLIMPKRHKYKDRLKYMKMLEKGYSINSMFLDGTIVYGDPSCHHHCEGHHHE